jgi:phosphoribosylformylglycinamidine synthase PurS subunit
MNFEVVVQLKPEVLDPEARAITETLQRQGLSEVKKIVVAKKYLLDIEASSEAVGLAKAELIAQEYLANPVSESYQVKRL